MRKLSGLFASRKSAANIGYVEVALAGILGMVIFAAIGLLIVVTILGVSPLNNTTGVSTINTNFISFVTNIFALLPVIGTFLALSILVAVVVVVLIFVKKFRGAESGEFSG